MKDIFEIVEREKAISLRGKYIYSFVDQNLEGYNDNISTLKFYEDGYFYSGYLWDYLRNNNNYELECTIENACDYLAEKDKIYIMWDLFSKTRVNDESYLANTITRDSVVQMRAQEAADIILREWYTNRDAENFFPEDFYCFDESMSWFVAFTHEGWDCFTAPNRGLGKDDYIRICFKFCKTDMSS